MQVYVLDEKRKKLLSTLFEAQRRAELCLRRNLLRRVVEVDENE